MSDRVLYLYENIIELTITANTLYMDNGPMNNMKLIAHRGVDNELVFSIRNKDRKLQNVFSQTLCASIVDVTNRRRVLNKDLEHGSEVGIAKLILSKGDLQNIQPGLYKIHVIRTANGRDLPMFSSQNSDVNFELEITDDTFVVPLETQETTVVSRDDSGYYNEDVNYVSAPLKGNLDRNFQNPLHTIGIYFTGFHGNVKVQGTCLTGVPDSNVEWFDILDIDITPDDCIYHNNFELNVNWIRVTGEPIDSSSEGTIDRVVLRN